MEEGTQGGKERNGSELEGKGSTCTQYSECYHTGKCQALHWCTMLSRDRNSSKDANKFHITVSAYHLSKRACGHWTRGRRAFVACSPQLSV